MADFNVAIIGCGDMGVQHAAAWQTRSDCKIVAVCDESAERRDALAKSTGAGAFSKHADAIAHDAVNVISICTPVAFHSEVGIAAARAGKHVLCEKPIALTLEQADAMIRAARENKVLLCISLQYRAFS